MRIVILTRIWYYILARRARNKIKNPKNLKADFDDSEEPEDQKGDEGQGACRTDELEDKSDIARPVAHAGMFVVLNGDGLLWDGGE